MFWRNAPFLLKLVLILTIVVAPTLTLAQVAEASLLVQGSLAVAHELAVTPSAPLDLEASAVEIASPKTGQVIKLIPSGRVIPTQPVAPAEEPPVTPIVATPASRDDTPGGPDTPTISDPVALEEPTQEGSVDRVSDQAKSSEPETKVVPDGVPAVPSFQEPSIPPIPPSQLDQDRSSRDIPLAVWLLLLPGVLLGLVWTVWQRQRKAPTLKVEVRSKPEAQSESTPFIEPQPTTPNIPATVVSPVESVGPQIELQVEQTGVQADSQEAQAKTYVEPTEPQTEIQAKSSAEVQIESQEQVEQELQIPAREQFSEPIGSQIIEVEELLVDDENLPLEITGEAIQTLPNILSDRTISMIQQAFRSALLNFQGKTLETATLQECYAALARLISNSILDTSENSFSTPEDYLTQGTRLVVEIATAYSPESQLSSTLVNVGLTQAVEQAIQGLGFDLSELCAQEQFLELGDPDLGRTMVSNLEALATTDVPAIGYGICYKLSDFEQQIRNGWQIESPGSRLWLGSAWAKQRLETSVEINFGGQTQAYVDERNHYRVKWVPQAVETATAYDLPIVGYKTNTVNILRLWQTDALAQPKYFGGSEDQVIRLKRQYVLVSCVLQDLFRLHLDTGGNPETFHDRFAVQMNDPDTVLTIAELMRLLLDEYGIAWDQAWAITQATLSYTHHLSQLDTFTDSYSLGVFSHLLPRHLEIIYEINSRLLTQIRISYPGEIDRVRRMSLIGEQGERFIRLIYLACLGVHAINGVSESHTQSFRRSIFKDFHDIYPEKFYNVPNGVTLRHLLLANPQLSQLITEEIGEEWIADLGELNNLEEFVEDLQFCQEWQQVKQKAKQNLAYLIQQQYGIEINPSSLFDVQIATIQGRQRQILNLLHIITLYNQIKANPTIDLPSRTFIFAGKSVPGDANDKLVIKLIHDVAHVINSDLSVQDRLKIVFLQTPGSQLVQAIYAAADTAEFIAIAGSNTSNTTNLSFAMNGAIIVGTFDGSNLELQQAVGAENICLFGLTAEEVAEFSISQYTPINYYNANSELQQAIDSIAAGVFSGGDTELFKSLIHQVQHQDPYRVLADYQAYVECQYRVGNAYRNQLQWLQKSILNTARIGKLSSDQTVREYSLEIWNVRPVTERLRQSTKLPSG